MTLENANNLVNALNGFSGLNDYGKQATEALDKFCSDVSKIGSEIPTAWADSVCKQMEESINKMKDGAEKSITAAGHISQGESVILTLINVLNAYINAEKSYSGFQSKINKEKDTATADEMDRLKNSQETARKYAQELSSKADGAVEAVKGFFDYDFDTNTSAVSFDKFNAEYGDNQIPADIADIINEGFNAYDANAVSLPSSTPVPTVYVDHTGKETRVYKGEDGKYHVLNDDNTEKEVLDEKDFNDKYVSPEKVKTSFDDLEDGDILSVGIVPDKTFKKSDGKDFVVVYDNESLVQATLDNLDAYNSNPPGTPKNIVVRGYLVHDDNEPWWFHDYKAQNADKYFICTKNSNGEPIYREVDLNGDYTDGDYEARMIRITEGSQAVKNTPKGKVAGSEKPGGSWFYNDTAFKETGNKDLPLGIHKGSDLSIARAGGENEAKDAMNAGRPFFVKADAGDLSFTVNGKTISVKSGETKVFVMCSDNQYREIRENGTLVNEGTVYGGK